MLDLIIQWYRRRFADPQAVALTVILLAGFGIIYFFSGILAPLLIAIVLAYLLEWPIHQMEKRGCPRKIGIALILSLFIGISVLVIFILAPTVWSQGRNLLLDMPNMFSRFNEFARELPDRFPALMDVGLMDMILDNARSKLLSVGDSVVKMSLASLVGLLALTIYLILVPLMIFFLLKDKEQMLRGFQRILPRNRSLAGQVWQEMNQQISNYIRGKVTEMIIVGVCTYIVFAVVGLNYALLLAVLVGVSVLIPYVGAVIVTVPVVLVGVFQWGLTSDFWTMFIAYLVVQGLDSNILVPILFSEAVNLHPLVIILSIIIFGGLWGFWGIFFAIPLATLIKAVIHAWPEEVIPETTQAIPAKSDK
ncbi:MAG: AI-2E family transporter [Morganella sp. (in: enterobacteria)]|uniref:AI-2E family transporter n=1 Tax=Morganella psychrotolerans TaxID=368603 RepID=A0A1B8HUK8_9GAMM|nr:AI-2E family transporter [Morganella psychrotolerans]OBU13408.1 AI-2E family transporter [Morganella psychrotolerans]